MLHYMYENESEYTIVVSKTCQFVYPNKRCVQLINEICTCYGSSYSGRKEAIIQQLNIKQKVPVLISAKDKMMLFPSVSIKRKDCVWINYYALKAIKKRNHRTLFVFEHSKPILVDIEIRSAILQIRRCNHFLMNLNEPINCNLKQYLKLHEERKSYWYDHYIMNEFASISF